MALAVVRRFVFFGKEEKADAQVHVGADAVRAGRGRRDDLVSLPRGGAREHAVRGGGAAGSGGEEPLCFRSEEVDPDTVYRALEARWPYAFALHATVRANKTTELRVEVSRPERQAQAKAYAGALAAECVTPDMTAEQKLRALHDALVRMCEYDVDTEEQEHPDGSAPAFSADGALLDHKAVCAGYGRAYAMLCDAADIPAVYVASEQMNHGWNAVRLDGKTWFIDCTFDDPVPDRGSTCPSSSFS